MISDLIVNISLMMSFTFIWHQLFKGNSLSHSSSLLAKLANGLMAGLLGIVLMYYSIAVNDFTILDLRHVAVVLVAFYGGVLPALIAGLVIGIGRFGIDVNFSSYVAFYMILAIAIGSGLISRYVRWGDWKKWTLLLFYSQLIFSISLWIVVEDFLQIIEVAFYHIISTFAGGYLVLYFVRYIRKKTDLYIQHQEEARRDPLTQLFNVRAFDDYYNHFLKVAIDEKNPLSVCIIDVDYFKKVNDTFGHPAGDEILKQIAYMITENAREQDVVSRNGGEEFSVLLPDTSIDEAVRIAERMRSNIEKYSFLLLDDTVLNVSVSIGVSCIQPWSKEQEKLFERADEALYQAKQRGRNRVCSANLATEGSLNLGEGI